jgi:hypothetical protein
MFKRPPGFRLGSVFRLTPLAKKFQKRRLTDPELRGMCMLCLNNPGLVGHPVSNGFLHELIVRFLEATPRQQAKSIEVAQVVDILLQLCSGTTKREIYGYVAEAYHKTEDAVRKDYERELKKLGSKLDN